MKALVARCGIIKGHVLFYYQNLRNIYQGTNLPTGNVESGHAVLSLVMSGAAMEDYAMDKSEEQSESDDDATSSILEAYFD